MANVTKTEVVTVNKTREVRVSDFSGVEMPQFHWSTVTNIHCYTSDHGSLRGNKRDIFNLDLMPEEMNDFLSDLTRLLEQHKSKWSRRRVVNKPSQS